MELHPAALGAVARCRAVGLHFWGQINGITPLDARPDLTRMRLAPESTLLTRSVDGDLPVDVTALATLADVSLGLAIRARGPRDRRLATTSFSLQQVRDARGAVTCHSELVWSDPGGDRALVRARLTDAAGLVAIAEAWFLTLPLGPDVRVTPMPWERTGRRVVRRVSPEDLTDDELRASRTATLACARAAATGVPLARALLGLEWSESGEEQVVGRAEIGPHLSNRVGDVQGGALLGFASTAGARLAAEGAVLADAHLQYIRPVRGEHLTVTASTVRRGRSAHFVDATVEVGGKVTNTARLTYLTGRR